MITEFEQWKTPSGNWIVIIRTDKDYGLFGRGPRIWWETDDTGEQGLAKIIEWAMR